VSDDSERSGPAPAAGPYAPVVRAGEWVITSGQLGVVPAPDGPTLVGPGTATQLRQALDNAAALLSSEGASLSDVRKATVYLVDMSDFAEMNAVWVEAFGGHRPARTAVGVSALPMGASVEVEVWAHRPAG
jgi:2-iminobutanoate/2-iminopropanoate deaminase